MYNTYIYSIYIVLFDRHLLFTISVIFRRGSKSPSSQRLESHQRLVGNGFLAARTSLLMLEPLGLVLPAGGPT